MSKKEPRMDFEPTETKNPPKGMKKPFQGVTDEKQIVKRVVEILASDGLLLRLAWNYKQKADLKQKKEADRLKTEMTQYLTNLDSDIKSNFVSKIELDTVWQKVVVILKKRKNVMLTDLIEEIDKSFKSISYA